MFPYVYIVIVPYTYIVTLVNPLYFLFFVIFVIYRPRFCPFVHFVIVLYCIYAFWVVSTREINLRSTTSTAGGARAWAVLLAKTSRTAVPTAIMPIIAGGRLYKCLYKMHVDSRAFWGAFWGAFRVFLRDVG